MTFSREHHQVIASVLGILDASVLREHQCYFAGGTALALRFGEYRESVDIDFIVSDAEAFRTLRSACRGPQGFGALTLPGQRVVTAGPMTSNTYGIRTRVKVGAAQVKLEILKEGNITLDRPGPKDTVLGVTTATVGDLVATKLMANSDRWMDPTVFSRDIIDLAMVCPNPPILATSVGKARAAYGRDVFDHAQEAIAALVDDQHALERRMTALGMTQPRALLVGNLMTLSSRLSRAWSRLQP